MNCSNGMIKDRISLSLNFEKGKRDSEFDDMTILTVNVKNFTVNRENEKGGLVKISKIGSIGIISKRAR